MSDKPPQYFEGTLQLRDVTEEVYQWVYDTIEREGKCHVAKEDTLKNGYDIYLSSNHYMQALGKRLKRKFNGELVVSRRLHTVDKMTMQPVYRVTVLFRQARFKKGDIVNTPDGKWKILQLGAHVHAKNMVTGKKKIFKLKDLERSMKVTSER